MIIHVDRPIDRTISTCILLLRTVDFLRSAGYKGEACDQSGASSLHVVLVEHVQVHTTCMFVSWLGYIGNLHVVYHLLLFTPSENNDIHEALDNTGEYWV